MINKQQNALQQHYHVRSHMQQLTNCDFQLSQCHPTIVDEEVNTALSETLQLELKQDIASICNADDDGVVAMEAGIVDSSSSTSIVEGRNLFCC